MVAEPDDSRLVRLLQEFSVASDRFVDRTSSTNHMHRTDLHALNSILRAEGTGEPHTATALARDLGLTRAAATALIDRLERSGHAERVRNATDRRVVNVVMTGKAREDGWRMFGPLATALMATLDDYTPEQKAVIERFLRDAINAVDTC